MEYLEINEAVCIIRRLREELDFHKRGLMELLLNLDKRLEILDRFKDNANDLFKLLKCGEIFNDIVTNYIQYLSVSETVESFNGEIVDLVKVYVKKAEKQVIDTQLFLFEIEEDNNIEDTYVNEVRKELEAYKSKDIFTELNIIEEILTSVSDENKEFYNGMSILLTSISEYKSLDEIEKENGLNIFCYENIENNSFVDKLIRLQNDYNGAEVIANVVEFEGMPLFSALNNEKLIPVLEHNPELYFRIISTLNQLQQLNQDLLNISNVNRQIEIIEEFLEGFSEYKIAT